jgi:hypothetical protein
MDPGIETCTGCKHAGRRWKFLGWRPFCLLYKTLRDIRCIDWRSK